MLNLILSIVFIVRVIKVSLMVIGNVCVRMVLIGSLEYV